jgi:hypothetical protein
MPRFVFGQLALTEYNSSYERFESEANAGNATPQTAHGNPDEFLSN